MRCVLSNLKICCSRMHVLLITLFLTGTVALNPGIRLLFTQKGIDYANSMVVSEIDKEIKTITMPTQSGKQSSVTYFLEDFTVSDFNIPKSNLEPAPGSELIWRASGISMDLKGKFRYDFKKWFVKYSDDGGLTMKMRGTTIVLVMKLGVDGKEKPSIKPNHCTCYIGQVHVKFHGGKAFIYNLFKGKVEKIVRKQLQKEICTIVKAMVEKKAEQSLSTLKVQFDLSKSLTLDCGLISAPFRSASDLQVNLKGIVRMKGDNDPIPFLPSTMRASANNMKMATVIVSEYVFNTLEYQAFKHGLLAHSITSKDIPDGDLLNTTSTRVCIGNAIPQIGQAFPNCKVEANIIPNQRPNIALHNGSVSIDGTAIINLSARKPDNSLEYLFRIMAVGSMTVIPTIINSVVHVRIGSMSVNVNVTNSAIGVIDSQQVQFLMNLALSTTVRPKLDRFGALGIPLPNVDGFKLQQPEMKLLENEIVFSTNIEKISTREE